MQDELERAGYRFRVEIEHDESMGEPWKEHDGHGVVSEWTKRGKRPGERVLAQDRDSFRYYDLQETRKIALKDRWGTREKVEGRTKRQEAMQAVEEDFQRMQDWCEDRWTWQGVVVTLLDADGNRTNEHESLWGIESDSGESYFDEVAGELADEIVSRLAGKDALKVPLRKLAVSR